ncbi:hypothetical protein EUGRSUZ_E01831 [Eucalyptus grandis]|uniref:Uncharacterized protein n=2 Tax=Eucalyptus grandis TaxID=71139 RepID=A0ACC3KV92_EUCGR|nr:hypothetical protein EUGRSUZ_E01831 [Eucalyptus grandis]
MRSSGVWIGLLGAASSERTGSGASVAARSKGSVRCGSSTRLGTGEREASSWVRAFCRRGPRICRRRDSSGWISAQLRL